MFQGRDGEYDEGWELRARVSVGILTRTLTSAVSGGMRMKMGFCVT